MEPSSRHRPNRVAGLIAVPGVAALLFTAPGWLEAVTTAEEAAADYHRLQEGRYTQAARTVPDGGITLRRDTATWTLESGEVRYLEPTSDGAVTGLVFEGRGRFRMSVPDPVEREQLDRLTPGVAIEEVDEPFTALVLRTSEPSVAELFPPPPEGPYDRDSMAADRHEIWLERRWMDADARVVCGSRIPGDEYLQVGIKTERFGWLTYRFDSTLPEEIELSWWNPKQAGTDSWVSLDRAGERDARGRPSSRWKRFIDLRHVRVRADLTEAAKRYGRIGLGNVNPRLGKLSVEMAFVPLVDGARALPLHLSAGAEVTAVTDAGGRSLPFLRENIGDRRGGLERDRWDDSLVVLLDEPLSVGEETRLTVDYELLFLNYAPGRSWYPGEPEGFSDLHTAELEITALDKHEVEAMGRLVEEREEGKRKVLRWEIERPVRMLTFAYSEGYNYEVMEREGLPEVVALTPTDDSNEVWNLAADVVNSLLFYQQLFGSSLPADRLLVTGIIGSHGQAFDGFIHMGESSIHYESRGPTERFRAHEVAHQWWGYRVAWASYRDQWLSESFAEYSAMMFLEATMEDGRKLYDEMVQTYTGQLLGEVKPTRFNRSGRLLEINDLQRERVGPIAVGWRASTSETSAGYYSQAYVKGPVVLHMLRVMLRNLTKSDDVFVRLLREFLDTYQGKEASTQDFVDTLARVAPGDWGWFFDQWVYGTEIPTYRWDYRVAPKPDAQGKYLLTLEVEQEGVPPGFQMPVPVELEIARGKSGQIVVLVDEPRETFEIPLPMRPKRVEFNPGYAVLAKVKRR